MTCFCEVASLILTKLIFNYVHTLQFDVQLYRSLKKKHKHLNLST